MSEEPHGSIEEFSVEHPELADTLKSTGENLIEVAVYSIGLVNNRFLDAIKGFHYVVLTKTIDQLVADAQRIPQRADLITF